MARLLRADDILPAAAWYCGVDPDAMLTPAMKATDRVRQAQVLGMYVLRMIGFSHAEIGHVFGRAGRSIISTMKAKAPDADAVRSIIDRARIEAEDNDRREANRRRAERLEEELRAC